MEHLQGIVHSLFLIATTLDGVLKTPNFKTLPLSNFRWRFESSRMLTDYAHKLTCCAGWTRTTDL